MQADLKTFAAHRVHGTCALTAVTAQNTTEVRGVVALEPAFVRRQIEAVLDDFDGARRQDRHAGQRAAIVGEVAAWPPRGCCPRLVVDPVLVSSSGHRLMEPDGVAAYLELLLPHALVVTPNLREAAVLGGTDVELTRDRRRPRARWPSASGPRGPATSWSRAATSPNRPTTSWPAPTG